MYARGHSTGHRRQTRQASSWYDAIAEATLARLDATWPKDTSTQEAPIAPSQDTGSTHQAQAAGTKD